MHYRNHRNSPPTCSTSTGTLSPRMMSTTTQPAGQLLTKAGGDTAALRPA
ncbi:MAG: hypothetical protein ACRYFZ_17800 [Janthinobacterium lividum]